MQSFHNDQTVKQKYVDRVKEHQLADEITQGVYWENGKGCAVGCTVHSGDHQAYETQLGLPEWLAKLEDKLFEGMSNADAKQFPLRFLEAINVGSDLSGVESKFMVVVLEFALKQFDNAEHPNCAKAVKDVIHFHKTGEGNLEKLRQTAGTAAGAVDAVDAYYAAYYAATDAAYYAAYYAAVSAYYAAERQETYKYFAEQLIDILKETK